MAVQKKTIYYRRERMMLAVEAVLAPAPALPATSSECKATCVQLQGANKKECENECDAWEATRLVAEKLRQDLIIAWRDIVWSGGDIDPLPDPLALERAVRNQFANGVSYADKPGPKK